ncbi:hypothetical protein SAMN04489712_11517 [Thermomonospora echinospora]|uniref:Uncharacterized protein n=1 Tax=Thermomonospora echinospora TaxID=1992 RepID=A0A1H6DAY4_9ACTN|nr:hypothetical protein [Thermomonospora echinospora]SEG82379.1 hypothetical protein SAMN04489712_11517 [Thermomonospora echinospora]
MITEDSIRETLEHGASQAPDPDRVLAGLPARIRTARRRRMATASAGTVAALVTLSAVVNATGLSPLDQDRNVATGGPGAGNAYGPTWLPSGMYEVVRTVSFTSGPQRYERIWSFGPMTKVGRLRPLISLTVAEDGESPLDPLPSPDGRNAAPRTPRHIPGIDKVEPSGGPDVHASDGTSPPPGTDTGTGTEQVTINGHPAVRERSSNICAIAWRPTPTQLLTVVSQDMGNDCTVASRFAQSVAKGSSAPVNDAIKVNRMPEGYRVWSTGALRTNSSGCVARLSIRPADPTADPQLPLPADQIEYGHGPLPEGGEPLTVGGRPARYYERLELDETLFQVVAIDLGDGRRLLVNKYAREPVPRTVLVEFAGQISVGEPPNCNWLRD